MLPRDQLAELGFHLILYPLTGLFAAARAIDSMYRTLTAEGTTLGDRGRLMTFAEFNELIGVDEKVRPCRAVRRGFAFGVGGTTLASSCPHPALRPPSPSLPGEGLIALSRWRERVPERAGEGLISTVNPSALDRLPPLHPRREHVGGLQVELLGHLEGVVELAHVRVAAVGAEGELRRRRPWPA